MHTDAAEIDEAAYLRAVAHPMRHRILAMLSEQESSPGRLAATLREKVNVVAYHVRRLHQLGLIDLVEVRRGRGGLIDSSWSGRPTRRTSSRRGRSC
jgi:DNA-binding transcriptional ArsR family regulator